MPGRATSEGSSGSNGRPGAPAAGQRVPGTRAAASGARRGTVAGGTGSAAAGEEEGLERVNSSLPRSPGPEENGGRHGEPRAGELGAHARRGEAGDSVCPGAATSWPCLPRLPGGVGPPRCSGVASSELESGSARAGPAPFEAAAAVVAGPLLAAAAGPTLPTPSGLRPA